MENDKQFVCPWWLGYVLASPIRKLFQDPEKILSPFVKEGMTVLDIGSAMGFFSLPMAQMVGEKGKVVCVDLQEKMISSLVRRAVKKGLAGRIEPRVCSIDSLLIDDLKEKIDFALASAVMHETPDRKRIFAEVYSTLKRGAVLFVSEPAGHVTETAFKQTIGFAKEAGFVCNEYAKKDKSFEVVLKKD